MNIPEVLQYKWPGCAWSLNGNSLSGLKWLDEEITRPTDVEILAASDEYSAHLREIEYKELRRREYPSIEDQLDLIYHFGIDVWKSKVASIKEKYPKGSS